MSQPNTNQFISNRQRSKRLEKLMNSGLVEGYGQRVQIGFEFLVLGSRDRFNLKDLAERGAVVFGFLSLPGNDNSFAIMDSFRHFDRGGGAVSLEDFGAGVIERLYQYHNNNSLLKSIARELIPSGRRSVSEVLSLLSDPAALPPLCRSHLTAHLTSLEGIVKEAHSSGALVTAPGALPDAQAQRTQPTPASASPIHNSSSNLPANPANSGSIGNTNTNSTGPVSVEYLSVSRFVECAQRALEDSCAEVCACLHLSARLRKQLQDESLTGYHYCLGTAEAQLTWALSRYNWDAGYPFWGGRGKGDKKLLEDSEDGSATGSDGEDAEDSEADALEDYEGPGSVLLGALQLLLPGEGADRPMELDEVQLYLLNKAQGALNQFICLLSDPDSPNILKEVESDMGSSEGAIAQLDRSAAAKVSGSNVLKLQVLSITENDGKAVSSSYTNALLLKELLDTQDKLLRAQIRLQVYQKLPPNVLQGDEADDDEEALEIKVDSNRNSDESSGGSESEEAPDFEVSGDSGEESDTSLRSDSSDDSEANSSQGHPKRKRHSSIMSATSDVFDIHSDYEPNNSLKEHSLSDSSEKEHSAVAVEGKGNHTVVFEQTVHEIPLDTIESRFTELEDLLTNMAGEDYVLGTFLERSCALVPYKMEHRVSKMKDAAILNSVEQQTIQPFMSHPSPNRGIEKEFEVDSKEEQKEELETSIADIFQNMHTPEIEHMSAMLSKLKTTIAQRKSFEQSQEQMRMKLSMYEERVRECMLQLEQAHRERDDALSQAVEVQILREKNIKLAAEEAQLHHLQQKNAELSRTVAELQRNLKDTTELYSKAHHEENLRTNQSKPFLLADGSSKAMQKQIHDLTLQKDKLSKENQRIVLASKQADQRMKAALQDHVSLRQKLNKAEDELLSSKTVISNLLGEIDHERSLRGDRDTLVRKSQELHMEVVELRGVVEESRVASAQLVKTKEELARAEDQIALLVEKLDDITKEAELSSIGQDQLDNLRAAVAMKAKENRELVVQTHNLERKLQELQGLETRHSDLCDEVTELKFKVDQMPPLLAELARLRGSHRATARVLHEQEKLVSTLRMKSSELEADNARLKAQNRIIEDLQYKLQHSEADCKRYAEMTREIPSLNAEIKKLQEDYRSVDTSHRKLRKIMRQTAIMGGHTQGDATAMG